MAEATTADVLEIQKQTFKKVEFIGNILNKNIVPASQQKERDKEDNAWKKKLFGFMSGFKDSLSGLKDSLKFKMKAAGGGLLSMLKKGLLLAAIPLILSLLNHPIWGTIKDWIVDDLIPALKKTWVQLKIFWEKLKPSLKALWEWVKTEGITLAIAGITAVFVAATALLDDINAALSGEGSWAAVLLENKLAIAAIALLLFPKLMFGAVKLAAVALGTALRFLMTKVLWPMASAIAHGLFTAVTKAAVAVGTAIKFLNTKILTPIITSLATKGLMVVRWAAAGVRTALLFLNTKIITPIITSLATKGLMLVKWAAAGLRTAILFLNTKIITPMITSLATAGMAVVTKAMAALRTAILFLRTEVIVPMVRSLATRGMMIVTKAMAALRSAILLLRLDVILPMIKSLATKTLMYIVKAAQLLRLAIIAMHGAILAPMLVALGPALVVAAPFIAIAALVALAIKSLYDAFVDAKAIFDETGDIWAALSEGLASFLGTFMGFIPDMVKNIVSWGLKKLGFTAAAEWLDSFSIVDNIKGMFRTMFDGVFKFLGGLLGSGATLALRIWGFVKALPGKIWDWLKTTVLGWFGLTTGDEKITGTMDEVDKPEANWLSTLFTKIFPEWLISPIKWIKGKLGLTDDDSLLKAASAGVVTFISGIGATIAAIFTDIFPEWITSPVKWIKGKLGLTDDDSLLKAASSGAVTFVSGIGAMIGDLFKDIFPDWLTSPITWIKEKLGLTTGTPLTDTTADSFFAKWSLPSWDSLKALMPAWLRDPVGWVKGLFGKADTAAQAEKDARELKVGAKSRIGITQTSLDETKATLSGMSVAGEARRFDIDAAAKEKRFALEDEIKKEQDELAGGDVKGGKWGFQYKREDRIKELQTELGAVNTQEQIDLAQSQLADTAEIKRLTDLQVSLETQLAADNRIMATDIATLVREATAPGSTSLAVHDVHLERLLLPMVDNMGALLTAFGSQGKASSMTVNNVSVSPNTTASVASTTITENVYGTTDPFTAVAGAYG